MRAVIFDLDGTLADTGADLVAAANGAFRAMGLPDLLDPRADAATALRGGKAMLRLGLSRVEGFGEDHVEREYLRLLTLYGDRLCVETRLYDGAAEAVRALRAEGYRTGICTNKPEALAVRLVEALGVSDLFDSLVGADTLPVRKPDPAPLRHAIALAGAEPGRACLVGDTRTDHDTARAAGVPSVLVSFGPGGEDIAALGPDATLDRYADLPRVVAALGL